MQDIGFSLEDVGFWYGIGFQSEVLGFQFEDMGFELNASPVDRGSQQQAAVKAYLLVLTKLELTEMSCCVSM